MELLLILIGLAAAWGLYKFTGRFVTPTANHLPSRPVRGEPAQPAVPVPLPVPPEKLSPQMLVDFFAIDVETASRSRHSICQIGIAAFHEGREVWGREILIDPLCDFDIFCTRIHGLTASDVRGAPDFGWMHEVLHEMLSGRLLVAHSDFDQQAFAAACGHHGKPGITAVWIDTVSVARLAWPELPDHKLPTVCDEIGHDLVHHQALEDARAAGQVLLRAMAETGHSLDHWTGRSASKAARQFSSGQAWPAQASMRRSGSGEGPLVECCVVLSGDFSQPKAALADRLAAAGAEVATGVSRKVTMLVIGARDAGAFSGKAKSNKLTRAEELIAEGYAIEILTEAEIIARL